MSEMKYNVASEVKKDWWLIAVICITWIITFAIYGRLPEKIPIHWNAAGHIDRYGAKATIFLSPSLTTLIYAGMLFLPLIDPRRANYAKFTGPYRVIRSLLVLIFVIIHLMSTGAALNYSIKIDRILPLVLSIMIIVMGNYMGKLRHNYFVGIKTPWTLADEDVWNKTHRFGGLLWVLAGLIGLIGSFIGGMWAFMMFLIPLLAASIAAVVYSYFAYKNKAYPPR
ncbi:SdpI family protein [Caldanaerobius polysaccharolyticus]|uniref:SdpI family protein n=1 Tax=Caldanaerobius polysaccharolyticus TaxID=44256 RepID=UPI0004793463|nr:SdpI family protein [Caldanaerobius polysaccharolyticus]